MYIKTYIKILSKSSEYKRVVIKYVVYISAYMCAWKQTSMYVHKYVCVSYIYIRKNIFLIDREK